MKINNKEKKNGCVLTYDVNSFIEKSYVTLKYDGK
jgi:hypothetical protein